MAGISEKFHMRREDKETTDSKKLEHIIRGAKMCHLALIDDDEPYVVPVTIGYDNGCIYFHSALEGRKVSIIKKNNRVCFNVLTDVEPEHIEESAICRVIYGSVIGVGRAYIIEDNEEKVRGLRAIMRQNLGYEFDFAQDRLTSTLVVRIDIEKMRGKESLPYTAS